MRKYIFIGIVTSFILACSFAGAVPAPEGPPASPTASPTHTSTPMPTATSTPRNTPTDIGYMLTQTALAPIQLLPGVYTATPISTVTAVDFATPATAGEGFESVEISAAPFTIRQTSVVVPPMSKLKTFSNPSEAAT